MGSPDASPYIDLTLSDLDPQSIFDAAIAEMKIQLPDWTPREGHTEVVLLEGMAVEVGELVYAINRVPSSVLQALLRLFGIEYDSGVQPTTNLRFNITSTISVTIPMGTEVRLDLPDSMEPVAFFTDNEVTVAPGTPFVEVPATGDRYTDEANGIAEGTVVEVLESMIYLDSVMIGTGGVIGGRDEETDEEYFERGVNILYRQTSTLVVPAQFVSAMLEQPQVERAFAIDNYNVVSDPDGNGPVGNDAGHISLFAYGDNRMLTTPEKDALIAAITPYAMGALTLHFADPQINTVNVTVTVARLPNWDPDVVKTNVENAINEYLNPMTWDWSKSVVLFELTTAISNAAGVRYVQTMTTPTGNVTLTGQAALADAGTVTVTVV